MPTGPILGDIDSEISFYLTGEVLIPRLGEQAIDACVLLLKANT
jgi:hypothetical protein